MKPVLITDDVHPIFLEGLTDLGFSYTYLPQITDAEVRTIIAPYEGLVVNSKINVDTALMAAAPQLKFVARLGAGMEIVDLPAAAARSISVFSAPEGNRNAVAEHTLGMMLSLAQNLNRADRQVRAFNWQREANRGFELRGKTIGIIGFGHTGSSFAAKLAGFGCRILAYDKYLPEGYIQSNFSSPESKLKSPSMSAFVNGVKILGKWAQHIDSHKLIPHLNYEFSSYMEASLNTIFDEADVVSLHLPLTPETHNMVNQGFLNAFRKPILLLNTARGKIVNTAHLLSALEAGTVAGAGLDVFENEKPAQFSAAERRMYAQLYTLENVLLTPHIAGWTFESKQRIAAVLLSKIKNMG
jgi:D-3-phosphoglycerate dehydrogenase / 2-oxoglutarate reductase